MWAGVAAGLRAADVAAGPMAVERASAQCVAFETRAWDAAWLRDTKEDYPLPERAEEFAVALPADGSWPDIDYASQAHPGRLLVDTPRLQVVRDDTGTLAVIFWEPGEWQRRDGGWRGADAPCIVLWRAGEVRVVEPTQNRSQHKRRLDDLARRVELPRGDDAGTAVELPRGSADPSI